MFHVVLIDARQVELKGTILKGIRRILEADDSVTFIQIASDEPKLEVC
jgi:trehalose-6-phosphatase